MNPVSHGVMLNADAALRQLSAEEQKLILIELEDRYQHRIMRPSRELERAERSCRDKRRYATLEQATEARKRVPGGNRLDVYQCLTCEHFHLGHSTKRS